jgi:hypothetical protein
MHTSVCNASAAPLRADRRRRGARWAGHTNPGFPQGNRKEASTMQVNRPGRIMRIRRMALGALTAAIAADTTLGFAGPRPHRCSTRRGTSGSTPGPGPPRSSAATPTAPTSSGSGPSAADSASPSARTPSSRRTGSTPGPRGTATPSPPPSRRTSSPPTPSTAAQGSSRARRWSTSPGVPAGSREQPGAPRQRLTIVASRPNPLVSTPSARSTMTCGRSSWAAADVTRMFRVSTGPATSRK